MSTNKKASKKNKKKAQKDLGKENTTEQQPAAVELEQITKENQNNLQPQQDVLITTQSTEQQAKPTYTNGDDDKKVAKKNQVKADDSKKKKKKKEIAQPDSPNQVAIKMVKKNKEKMTFQKKQAKKLKEIRDQNSAIMNRLFYVTLISFIFMCFEMYYGYKSNSLAVITDASHLLSDASGFFVQYISIKLSLSNKKTSTLSYGYARAEILGSLASIIIIWSITTYIVYLAVWRAFFQPDLMIEVKSMFFISICSLIYNVANSLIINYNLFGNIQNDPNKEQKLMLQYQQKLFSPRASFGIEKPHLMRKKSSIMVEDLESYMAKKFLDDQDQSQSQLVSLLTEVYQSIIIVVLALMFYYTKNWFCLDAYATLLFSLVVIVITWRVTSDIVVILMESAPSDVDVGELERQLKSVEGVKDIHDLHVWALSNGQLSLSAHMESNNPTKTLILANRVCMEFGIFHTTIQVEDYNFKDEIDCDHLNTNLIHE